MHEDRLCAEGIGFVPIEEEKDEERRLDRRDEAVAGTTPNVLTKQACRWADRKMRRLDRRVSIGSMQKRKEEDRRLDRRRRFELGSSP